MILVFIIHIWPKLSVYTKWPKWCGCALPWLPHVGLPLNFWKHMIINNDYVCCRILISSLLDLRGLNLYQHDNDVCTKQALWGHEMRCNVPLLILFRGNSSWHSSTNNIKEKPIHQESVHCQVWHGRVIKSALTSTLLNTFGINLHLRPPHPKSTSDLTSCEVWCYLIDKLSYW